MEQSVLILIIHTFEIAFVEDYNPQRTDSDVKYLFVS